MFPSSENLGAPAFKRTAPWLLLLCRLRSAGFMAFARLSPGDSQSGISSRLLGDLLPPNGPGGSRQTWSSRTQQINWFLCVNIEALITSGNTWDSKRDFPLLQMCTLRPDSRTACWCGLPWDVQMSSRLMPLSNFSSSIFGFPDNLLFIIYRARCGHILFYPSIRNDNKSSSQS